MEYTGAGMITLQTDGKYTDINCSDMELYVMAHLFYYALLHIPMSYDAMTMAILKYEKEQFDKKS